jgi:hypothetical protein
MILVFSLLALASVVALVVSTPLGGAGAVAATTADRRAELETAKEAKYREIRDAQLDFKLGKVSADDHQATQAELQGQALAIVRELDGLR